MDNSIYTQKNQKKYKEYKNRITKIKYGRDTKILTIFYYYEKQKKKV